MRSKPFSSMIDKTRLLAMSYLNGVEVLYLLQGQNADMTESVILPMINLVEKLPRREDINVRGDDSKKENQDQGSRL
jgi:hypothetical protein